MRRSYSRAPILPFLGRMLLPLAVVVLFASLAMGQLAGKAPSEQYRFTFWTLNHIPEDCWAPDPNSDFQKKECAEFWGELGHNLSLVAIPVAAGLLFLGIAFFFLVTLYRRVRSHVVANRILFQAKATQPARLPNDIFGWVFGLKSVSVQLADKRQIRVYLPSRASTPLPGEDVAVFEALRLFGAQRYLGAHYTPHVLVVGKRVRH